MNIKQSFALALKSLMGSKMRSFLTMLGIIIGVGSVIILVSVMDGMNQKTISQFESMGTNLISISIRGRGGNRSISPEQMQTLVDKNPDAIAAISPNAIAFSSPIFTPRPHWYSKASSPILVRYSGT